MPHPHLRLRLVALLAAASLLCPQDVRATPPASREEMAAFEADFTAGPVTDYASAKTCDLARFASFFRGMRDRGVSLPPSQFEAMFVSLAFSDDDIDAIVTAAAQTLAAG